MVDIKLSLAHPPKKLDTVNDIHSTFVCTVCFVFDCTMVKVRELPDTPMDMVKNTIKHVHKLTVDVVHIPHLFCSTHLEWWHVWLIVSLLILWVLWRIESRRRESQKVAMSKFD